MMALPISGNGGLHSRVAEHFGRSDSSTFIDDKEKFAGSTRNSCGHSAGTERPPELLKRHGVSAVLCREIGPEAITLCEESGIEVFASGTGTVREVFRMWKEGKMRKAGSGDACRGHAP